MSTPRFESISKAMGGETAIREPSGSTESENKIDHFAVLSQVINSAFDTYLSNPEYHTSLENAHSIRHLDANFRFDINKVIQLTLTDNAFQAHHDSLAQSVEQRRLHEGKPWDSITENIQSGVGTFVSATSYLFQILASRFGPEAASETDNWKILDKLAKLHLSAFGSFYRTYFLIHENHTKFIDQLQRTSSDGYIFKSGYPKNAPVTVAATPSYTGLIGSDSLTFNHTNPTVKLGDIPFNQATIGCPITFEPKMLEKLWGLYASHVYKFMTTPAIVTDDSEAFRR